MNWIKRYFKKRKIREQIKLNNHRIYGLNASYSFYPNELILKQILKLLSENNEQLKELEK